MTAATTPTARTVSKPTVSVTTFGYLHPDGAPQAHITLDLRVHFKDPHVSPELRYMTAHDEPVRRAVMDTPGIKPLITATAEAVRAFLAGPSAGPVTVAVGCAGGRHRAATVGMALTEALREDGQAVALVHRDLDKAVLRRSLR